MGATRKALVFGPDTTPADALRAGAAIDADAEGSLYWLNLALADAYEARRRHRPGTPEAQDWTRVIAYLEQQWQVARRAADSRFDPSGL